MTNRIYKNPIDIHGFGEQTEFDRAFLRCLWDGVYPGPTEINKRRYPKFKPFKRLNGRLTKRRQELMTWFGIPYQRGWTSFAIRNKGQLPFPDDPNANTLTKEMFGYPTIIE